MIGCGCQDGCNMSDGLSASLVIRAPPMIQQLWIELLAAILGSGWWWWPVSRGGKHPPPCADDQPFTLLHQSYSTPR